MISTTPSNPRTRATMPALPLDDALLKVGARAETLGAHTLRYGLVLILLWIGGMKFTAYEAEGIRPFVENSPLMAWTYSLFGIRGMSNLLGGVEILVGLLIAVRPWHSRLSALGSLMAVGMFLSTLSFVVTTPGVWADEVGGFPALSVLGQFLIKDVALLAAAVWTFGEAASNARRSLNHVPNEVERVPNPS